MKSAREHFHTRIDQTKRNEQPKHLKKGTKRKARNAQPQIQFYAAGLLGVYVTLNCYFGVFNTDTRTHTHSYPVIYVSVCISCTLIIWYMRHDSALKEVSSKFCRQLVRTFTLSLSSFLSFPFYFWQTSGSAVSNRVL